MEKWGAVIADGFLATLGSLESLGFLHTTDSLSIYGIFKFHGSLLTNGFLACLGSLAGDGSLFSIDSLFRCGFLVIHGSLSMIGFLLVSDSLIGRGFLLECGSLLALGSFSDLGWCTPCRFINPYVFLSSFWFRMTNLYYADYWVFVNPVRGKGTLWALATSNGIKRFCPRSFL